MIQNRTVVVDGKTIEFQLQRKNVKNINIRIKTDGTVYVSANPRINVRDIDDLMMQKANTIFSSKEKVASLGISEPKTLAYVEGEIIVVLGNALTLKIIEIESTKTDYVKIENASLCVYINDTHAHSQIERLVHAFLSHTIDVIFLESMQNFQELVQRQLQNRSFKQILPQIPIPMQKQSNLGAIRICNPKLSIKKMKSLWGSCTPTRNKISLNWHLIHAPRNCIDYVVLHELCHFVYQNHSKDFYDFLGEIMPEYKVYRNELKRYSKYLK